VSDRVVLVGRGNVALDGINFKAKISKPKAMSHWRMLKTETQLESDILALLHKPELIGAHVDEHNSKSKLGDETPKELQRRQDRLDARTHRSSLPYRC
jgi:hypothetical protein